MILFTKERISLFFFFFFFFILGIIIFKDFGISWDEVTSRNNGIVSLNYIATLFDYSVTEHFGNRIPLHEYFDKDYGVAFELSMAFFEYVFNIRDTQNIFYLRHFFTYLVFLFAAYSIYEMSNRRFDNWIVGLFSASIFILSPRIFAEAFYNDKDIVFMSTFAIAMNYNIKFLLASNIRNALLASFFTAFAVDVRIMGVIIPVVTFTIIIINLLKDRAFFQKKITLHLLYLILLVFFIILMWPWLWEDPIKNFLLAFNNMAHFRWEGIVLFNGSYVKSTQLPWYYAPAWITITTPPIYIIFFIIGSLKVIHKLIINNYKLWNNDQEMQDYMFFGIFILPLLAVIALNSVLYDGWRQLYFIYPAFILVSTYGALVIWEISKKSIKYMSIIFIIGCISNIIITMWSMHPLQNVYFNFFAGQ